MRKNTQPLGYLLGLFLLFITAGSLSARIVYVDVARVGGAQNGTSWTNAYSSLQTALTVAISGDSLWVADGTYYPGPSGSRTASFYALSNVRLFGGFTGFGGLQETSLSQRNWTLNLTTLSGDLDQSGTFTDNDAYHVIQSLGGMDTTATFNGFKITGGNANGSGANQDAGGGILFINSGLRIENCDVNGNFASSIGAGLRGTGHFVAKNCFIRNNITLYQGAGGYITGAVTQRFTNCVFSNNTASHIGGALVYSVADARFYNCTFAYNAGLGGRAVFNFSAATVFHNCIFWGHLNPATQTIQGTLPIVNRCIFEGGFPSGTNIIDADPAFRDADYRIKSCSPAADAGDSLTFVTTDLDGAPRPFDVDNNAVGKWDLGAFEAQALAVAPATNGISGPSPSCANQQNVIYQPTTNNAPTNTYTWSLSGGGTIDGPNTGNTVAIDWGAATGTYTITMTEAGAISGCGTANTLSVTLQPAPTVTLSPNGTGAICAGDSVQLTAIGTGTARQWYRNGVAIPGATGTSIQAKLSGVYNVLLTGVNGCADSAAARYTLAVNPLPVFNISPSGPQAICQGQTLTLTAPTPGNAYQWFRNGNPIAGATASTFAASLAGTYNVRYTNTNGCTDYATSTVVLTVNSLPTVTITPPGIDTTCPGVPRTFTASATNATAYQWYRNGALIGGATASTLATSTAGIHNCRITNNNTCQDSAATGKRLVVGDFQAPVATCRNRTFYLSASPGGSIPLTGADLDNGSTDNCNITARTPGLSTLTCANVGTSSITLTVQDIGSNTATCTSQVTVIDSVKPVATCTNPTLYIGAAGTASLTMAQAGPSSQDNCGITTVSFNPASYTCADTGLRAFTMTLLDGSGNARACSGTVTVEDSTRPNANCASPSVILNALGNASITPAQADNGSTDNCGIATRTLSRTAFTCADVPGVNATLTLRDVSGNTSTCIAYVRVQDTVRPTATCRDTVIYIDFSGQSLLSPANVDNGSADNCAITQRTLSQYLFTCQDTGLNTVTLTVQDADTNIRTCLANVTVYDTVHPTAICTTTTFYINPAGQANVDPLVFGATSVDNCTYFDTAFVNIPSYTCAGIGPHTVRLTLRDAGGAVDTCSGTVIIADSSGPDARCRNITLTLSGGTGTITTPQIDNGTTDNCQLDTLYLSRYSFACADVGTQQVTLTARDIYGNDNTCQAQVTVTENTPPIAICQPRTIHLNAAGTATITAAAVNNGSTDNCSTPSLSLSQTTFTCSQTGPNTVQLTVTDAASNTATCNATVTVIDSIRPVAVCAPATAYIGASGTLSITPALVDAGSSDNCSISTRSLSSSSFTCADTGTVALTLTIVDPSGNNRACTASLTIRDTTPPTPACINPTVYLNSIGVYTLNAATLAPSASDNCGIASTTLSQSAFSCADVGTRPLTASFRDVSGNTAQCAATITVIDTVRPTVTCNNLTVVLDAAGNASITEGMVDAGSADVCGIDNRILSRSTFNCADIGNTSITLTVLDPSGNTRACTASITVLDTIRPIATCLPQAISLDSSGIATLDPNAMGAPSNDACSPLSFTPATGTFTCTQVGTTLIRLTVADPAGNLDSCFANVTITDSIRPIAQCDSIAIQLDSTGQATLSPAMVGSGSWDNCSNLTMTLSRTSFNCTDFGYRNVLLTVSDPANQTDTCTAVVHVVDTLGITAVGLDLGPDTISCNGAGVTFYGTPGMVAYLWNTGAFTDSLHVVATATYTLTVTDAIGCVGIDSVHLTNVNTPDPNLRTESGEVVICQNDTLRLLVNNTYTDYLWSTGSTTSSTTITTGGTYIVQLTDQNGCEINRSITIQSVPFPAPQPIITPADPVNACEGTPVVLDVGTGYFQYLWNTGQTTQTITVGANGTYWVQVWNGFGCHSTASAVNVNIRNAPIPDVLRAVDTLYTTAIGIAYQWFNAGVPVNNGTQYFYWPQVAGNYTVRVTYSNGCMRMSDVYAFAVGREDEQGLLAGIGLYPNPSTGRVSISPAQPIHDPIHLRVIDLHGREMQSLRWPDLHHTRDLDLGPVAAGVYILELRSGESLTHLRVVKQ